MSYASQDRAEVTARIQGMCAAAPGMDIFLDVENLRSGAMRETRLFEEIQNCNICFCSGRTTLRSQTGWTRSGALPSPARDRQVLSLYPLESPSMYPPPDKLKCRHFDDWTLRYQRYTQAQDTS